MSTPTEHQALADALYDRTRERDDLNRRLYQLTHDIAGVDRWGVPEDMLGGDTAQAVAVVRWSQVHEIIHRHTGLVTP